MLDNSFNIIGLIISTLMIFALMWFIRRSKNNKQIATLFIMLLCSLLICCVGLISQIIFCNIFPINPIYFDYFVYIGTCFMPVLFFLISFSFSKTKLDIINWFKLLSIIPACSLIALWTNDFHHLFYQYYSVNFSGCIVGFSFYVHSIYSYCLIGIGLINLFIYNIKNSGFFSKQSILLFLGVTIPVIINMLGILAIIPMSSYLTPISFTFSIFFFAFAILKFKFLKVAPIALQRIVDNISDGYIVLNEDNIITDFNKTFLTIFNFKDSDIRNSSFTNLLSNPIFKKNNNEFLDAINNIKNSSKNIKFEKNFSDINMFFNIEISGIYSNKNFLGTLILFKDITQHTFDMQVIKSNQDLLMEKERLASLGQLIGGIAHNLKTPIMSIAGAAEGLSDLTKEYDSSIEDPDVTVDDHHAISHDMLDWIEKIKIHTRYMSDVITAVKGQAVALSDTESDSFTIDELIKHIDILMKHELNNALINLNVKMLINSDLQLQGNINSLVQVINNIISNSIQAYNGKTNQVIDFSIKKVNDDLIISIQDYASGMPKEVVDKLFKEMVTTKGKNGTGLGLFMSYSNIRAHFNGHMTVKSELNKGTIIEIILPV